MVSDVIKKKGMGDILARERLWWSRIVFMLKCRQTSWAPTYSSSLMPALCSFENNASFGGRRGSLRRSTASMCS